MIPTFMTGSFLLQQWYYCSGARRVEVESRIGEVHYASVSSVEPNSCACNSLYHTLLLSQRNQVFLTLGGLLAPRTLPER